MNSKIILVHRLTNVYNALTPPLGAIPATPTPKKSAQQKHVTTIIHQF